MDPRVAFRLLPLPYGGDAITTILPDQAEASDGGGPDGVRGMSARVGTGLFLDFVKMLGGVVGIGLPMAVAIIWICS